MESFLPNKGVRSVFQNDADLSTWSVSLRHTVFALGGGGRGEVLIRSTQDALQDLLTHAQSQTLKTPEHYNL